MSFEDIVCQILSARKDLTREAVLKMVESKEKSAKGFLTRETAARAVALELGIEIPKVSFKHEIMIKDLVSGLNDVTVMGRIIRVYPIQRFVRPDETEGMLRRLTIADKTGEVKVALWDDKADSPNIKGSVDQIAKFSHGYIRRGLDGKLELNIGLKGNLGFSLHDISEEDYPPLTHYTKRIGEITGKEKSVNVIGIIEEAYPTTMFKRQDGSEGKLRRLKLKDSSGRIVVVLWDRKVDELTGIENGKRVIIFEAKVKKRLDEKLELHAENSTNITVTDKRPSGFASFTKTS